MPAASPCCCRRSPPPARSPARSCRRSTASSWPAAPTSTPPATGRPAHPRTGAPRTDRDAWEDALLTEAIAIELPFLGICRGAQVLNVALGGTLHQHLPDVVGSERYQPSPAVFGEGEVTVEPDSRLAALLGTGAGSAAATLPVHYYHHQALDEVADGLTVTARSEDGVIEAVELDGVPFGLGRAVASRGGRRRPAAVRRARRRRPHPPHQKEPRVSHTIVNPADEAIVATVTSASIEETDVAIARAAAAQRDWAATRARRSRLACCAASPRPSTAPSRSSRRSRCATRGIRSRRRAGRPGTCATCSSTTRPRPSGCSGARSRSRAASTSRSRSRSAWSA